MVIFFAIRLILMFVAANRCSFESTSLSCLMVISVCCITVVILVIFIGFPQILRFQPRNGHTQRCPRMYLGLGCSNYAPV